MDARYVWINVLARGIFAGLVETQYGLAPLTSSPRAEGASWFFALIRCLHRRLDRRDRPRGHAIHKRPPDPHAGK